MRNLIVGVAVAIALGLSASGVSVGGVAAWKVVAAAVGLAIFMTASRPRGHT